jgi:hypothetical protein
MTRFDLASTQQELADAFRSPTPLTSDVSVAAIATGNDRLTPAGQLDIYREQFFLRHLDALRDDFGAIRYAIGDDTFDKLGEAYLQAFPPRSFTLRDLGSDLARFVSETAPWASDPLVAELARIEWAFVEAFDAPDVPALDLAAVASIAEDAWSSAQIVLAPTVRRLALDHPVHDFRLAVRRGESPSRPEPSPCWVIVFRGPELLQCLDVERDAFALLEELARGAPLGDACERVSGASEEQIGAWFQEWTALGLIARVETRGA